MHTFKSLILLLLLFTIMPATATNVLLQPFSNLHETAPFTKITADMFLPAFDEAIKQARLQLNELVNTSQPPDFDNTIVALDNMGALLDRTQSILFNLNSAETNDALQAITAKVAPILSDFSNDVAFNTQLFARIKQVYDNKSTLNLTSEQQQLLENTYVGFLRRGANLSPKEQATFRRVSKKLTALELKFEKNVLLETNKFVLHVTNIKDLEGIPEIALATAQKEAQTRKKEGWIFTLKQPSYNAVVTYAQNRSLRQQIFCANKMRCNKNDKYDNKKNIYEQVNLRLQLAKLLGYSSYASYVLQRRMAMDEQHVNDMLNNLHTAARNKALLEVEQIKEFANQTGFKETFMPWDWAYFAEKYKEKLYGFDEETTRPYFEINKVKEAVFGLAKRLYGLEFKRTLDVEVYHPDVEVYEVFDSERKTFIAVLYYDPFPRVGKRGGAWMTDFRPQYIAANGQNVRPHVSIVTNFTPSTDHKPSLLTFYEVETLLHEFGHALHGMLSQCTYKSISGTNVYWDFVEFPSQLHENWAYEPEFLNSFAAHYQTQEPMPKELVNKLIASRNYLTASACERQIGLGTLDMAFHTITEPLQNVDDVMLLETSSLQPTLLMEPTVGGATCTSFTHIFGGSYAAGYYSYKWSEVIDADAFDLFTRNGIFDAATAHSLKINVLEKGGSAHPMELYKAFAGREPHVDALLKRSGL